MKKNQGKITEINDLLEDIADTLQLLSAIDASYRKFKEKHLKKMDKNEVTAEYMSSIIVKFYTALETLFVSIAQYFENHLSDDRWHSELLNKMILKIENKRMNVISQKTYSILLEFMKFRHFTRHYLKYEYDWERLDELAKLYEKVKPMIEKDLDVFKGFLNIANKNLPK